MHREQHERHAEIQIGRGRPADEVSFEWGEQDAMGKESVVTAETVGGLA